MSRRTDLVAEMKKFTGGAAFIDRKQLAKFLGYSDPHSIDQYLFGLPHNGRKYFCADVADRIIDLQQWD